MENNRRFATSLVFWRIVTCRNQQRTLVILDSRCVKQIPAMTAKLLFYWNISPGILKELSSPVTIVCVSYSPPKISEGVRTCIVDNDFSRRFSLCFHSIFLNKWPMGIWIQRITIYGGYKLHCKCSSFHVYRSGQVFNAERSWQLLLWRRQFNEVVLQQDVQGMSAIQLWRMWWKRQQIW